MQVRFVSAIVIACCVLAASCTRPLRPEAPTDSASHVHAVMAGKTVATRRTHAPAVRAPLLAAATIAMPPAFQAMTSERIDGNVATYALAVSATHGSRAPPRV
jgi:hypothetical protein